jgi:hypothetical protein
LLIDNYLRSVSHMHQPLSYIPIVHSASSLAGEGPAPPLRPGGLSVEDLADVDVLHLGEVVGVHALVLQVSDHLLADRL